LRLNTTKSKKRHAKEVLLTVLRKSKEIRIEDMGGASDLLCPRCGADLLHHFSVSVFDRSEDAETVVLTKIEKTTVSMMLTDNSANPSSRRHGVAIRFGAKAVGAISQMI
jgi:hypothetical protein